MILAYLLLLTGLTISAVAIYYSVVGLTSIFAAAAIPVMIMGATLEVAKLVCATWIKANWTRVPMLMKTYMCIAVIVLMMITSMGIFGFLSKAHLDQSLVSGDVVDKVAIIDEKIKTERDNIESARRALTQMDSAVDQTMSRSSDEKGADKAAALRRSQAKERGNLQNDIQKSQKTIASLNEERAPIAKDLRKVEAEVGPIKYIAALIYGVNPDATILEKAVTWVIIMIVIVFDPLAVIMLLAAQMSFAWAKQQKDGPIEQDEPVEDSLEESNLKDFFARAKEKARFWDKNRESQDEQTDTELTADQLVQIGEQTLVTDTPEIEEETELDRWNKMIEEAEREVAKTQETTVEERVAKGETYIDNEGNEISALEEAEIEEPQLAVPNIDLPVDESKKKTYMIKDSEGNLITKNRT
jgi:hypothetical protein